MLYSTVPERADAVSVAGALLSGPVYIFTIPGAPVERVLWYLDDPALTAAPYQVEYNAPYDFAGGTVATPRAFDTSDLALGPHSISALLIWVEGEPTSITADFSVSAEGSASVSDDVSLAPDPSGHGAGAERLPVSERANRSFVRTPGKPGEGRASKSP